MKKSSSSVILPSIIAGLLVPESKLFSLGISGIFELCDDSRSELKQFHWISIDSDVDIWETSSSDLDRESSGQEESLKHGLSERAVFTKV